MAPAYLTLYLRAVRTGRDRIEASMTSAVQVELSRLWRRFRADLMRMQGKAGRMPALHAVVSQEVWRDYEQAVHKRVQAEALKGAAELAGLHTEWIRRILGEPIRIVTSEFAVASAPELATMITNSTIALQRISAQRIIGWYNTPGSTVRDLVRSLQPEFGAVRAELIGRTEVTRLDSAVQEQAAGQLGITEWWWNTRRDQSVCERKMRGPDGASYMGCMELHGKHFKIGQLMPPDGSHPGCRCSTSLILPMAKGLWLGLDMHKVYNPNEPRDKTGEWTTGGGAPKKAGEEAGAPVAGHLHMAPKGKNEYHGTNGGLTAAVWKNPVTGSWQFGAMDPKTKEWGTPVDYNRLGDALQSADDYLKTGTKDPAKGHAAKAGKVKILAGVKPKTGEDARIFIAQTQREEVGRLSKLVSRKKEIFDQEAVLSEEISSVLRDAASHPDWSPEQKADAQKKIHENAAKITALLEEWDIHLEEKVGLDQAATNRIHEIIKAEHPSEVTPVWAGALTTLAAPSDVSKYVGTKSKIAEGFQMFGELVDASVLENLSVPKEAYVWPLGRAGDSDRAHYISAQKAVVLGQYDGSTVTVHELGHWLEDVNDMVHFNVVAFLKRRTVGEAPIKMNDATKGTSFAGGYRDDEMTRKDAFPEPYCGKVYGNADFQLATEILSMGLQYMAEDPAKFAQADPEYFDLIWDIAHGKYTQPAKKVKVK